MYTVLIVLHVLLAVALVAVVLVQRGPGATMGAAFGAGASGTVFGSRGAAGFLTKLTSWLGVAFFAISLSMAVMVARSNNIAEQNEDLGAAAQLVSQPEQAAGAGEASGESAEGGDAQASGDDEFLDAPVEGESASTTEDGGEGRSAGQEEEQAPPPRD
jgi:preprotein translocase subunit SecG